MNLAKRYESLSLKYRAAVLEREIHQDSMTISVREFIQAISDLLEELGEEEREKYKNITNPSQKEIESDQPTNAEQKKPENHDEESQEDVCFDQEEQAPPPEPPEPPEPPSPPEQTMDPRYKEVYRKLALQLHPDKLISKSKRERSEKTELFKEIQAALSNGDYSALLRVASIMGVSLEEVNPEDIEFLKNLIETEEEKINQIRGSWAWNWYHENSTSKKDEIMLEYIKQNLKK